MEGTKRTAFNEALMQRRKSVDHSEEDDLTLLNRAAKLISRLYSVTKSKPMKSPEEGGSASELLRIMLGRLGSFDEKLKASKESREDIRSRIMATEIENLDLRDKISEMEAKIHSLPKIGVVELSIQVEYYQKELEEQMGRRIAAELAIAQIKKGKNGITEATPFADNHGQSSYPEVEETVDFDFGEDEPNLPSPEEGSSNFTVPCPFYNSVDVEDMESLAIYSIPREESTAELMVGPSYSPPLPSVPGPGPSNLFTEDKDDASSYLSERGAYPESEDWRNYETDTNSNSNFTPSTPPTRSSSRLQYKKELKKESRLKKKAKASSNHGTGNAKQKKIQEKRPHKCEICLKRFLLKASVKNHMVAIHGAPKYFGCRFANCNKEFFTLKQLQSHKLKSHSTLFHGSPYKCSTCSRLFVSKSGYLRHLSKHNKNRKREFHCDICPLSFFHRHDLRQHKIKIHQQKKKLEEIETHQKKEHSSSAEVEQQFPCIVCGERFRSSYDRKIHEKGHLSQRPFKCTICTNKTFKRKNHLQTHMQTTHGDTKKLKCRTCSKMFVGKFDLTNHEKNAHSINQSRLFLTKKKNVKCPICRKTFFNNAGLGRHMIMHKDKDKWKKEEMKVSKKTSPSSSSQPRKRKKFSPSGSGGGGKREWKCSMCPNIFYNKRNVERHEAAHFEKKAFWCKFCGKLFMNQERYKNHEKGCK